MFLTVFAVILMTCRVQWQRQKKWKNTPYTRAHRQMCIAKVSLGVLDVFVIVQFFVVVVRANAVRNSDTKRKHRKLKIPHL